MDTFCLNLNEVDILIAHIELNGLLGGRGHVMRFTACLRFISANGISCRE